MINAFGNIMNETPNEVSDKFLYPLMIWFSGNYKNVHLCNKINKNFFWSKPKILKGMLSLGIDKGMRFIKYPKADAKEQDKKEEILKPILKGIYNYSDREYNINKKLLYSNLDLQELNRFAGFSKKECKVLGIEFKTFDVDKNMNKQKGLFDTW